MSINQLVKRMQATEFDGGIAEVLLDGEPIGRLYRQSPRWIVAECQGRLWGGGKSTVNALKAVAVAYQTMGGAA